MLFRQPLCVLKIRSYICSVIAWIVHLLPWLAISINQEQADPTYTSKSDLAYLFKKLMKIAITYKQHHEE